MSASRSPRSSASTEIRALTVSLIGTRWARRPETSRPSPASCSPISQQSLTSRAPASGSRAASRFQVSASSITRQTLPTGEAGGGQGRWFGR
ncbi:hypothetical protein [Streptomyces sp. SS8]